MSRGYNFSAGPSTMPEPVLRRAQAEMLEWSGERASVMEVSHRGKAFVALNDKLEADLRRQGLPAERIAALVPHKVHQGSRPSTVCLFEKLDPATLATLKQIGDVLASGDLRPSDYAKLRPLFDKILEIHYPET